MLSTDTGSKMHVEDMMDLLMVPEDLVNLCSQTLISMDGEEADNTFKSILEKGEVLKEHGRTPIYMCTLDMKQMYITSKEKIARDYH